VPDRRLPGADPTVTVDPHLLMTLESSETLLILSTLILLVIIEIYTLLLLHQIHLLQHLVRHHRHRLCL